MWSDGGFDTSASGGGFASPAPESTDKGKTKYKDSYVTPCSINQILTAQQEDDNIMICGRRMGYVTIVAQIQAMNQTSTAIDYELTDESAQGQMLKVKQWVAESTTNTNAFQQEEWCRVYGHIRTFQEQLSMLAFKVLPLVSEEEVRMHALEVEQAKLWVQTAVSRNAMASAGPSGVGGAAAAGGGDAMDYSGFGGGVSAGFNPQQKQVYDLICSVADPTGAHIDFLKQKLPAINISQIRSALDFLSSEGHIYSTIDEDHFKSTDG